VPVIRNPQVGYDNSADCAGQILPLIESSTGKVVKTAPANSVDGGTRILPLATRPGGSISEIEAPRKYAVVDLGREFDQQIRDRRARLQDVMNMPCAPISISARGLRRNPEFVAGLGG